MQHFGSLHTLKSFSRLDDENKTASEQKVCQCFTKSENLSLTNNFAGLDADKYNMTKPVGRHSLHLLDILPVPVLMVQTVVVNQAGFVSMNESTEGQTVSPGGRHVHDLDPRVSIQLLATPFLKSSHPHHDCKA